MMGLLQAIVSKSLHTGDAIRAVTIGQTKVVFVLKGPLYLIAASSTQEPTEHLQRQLEHLHGCIVFVLTEKVWCCGRWVEVHCEFSTGPCADLCTLEKESEL